MTVYSPPNSESPFLATTRTYPKQEDERLVTHEHTYTETAQAVNQRVIGYYSLNQVMTGRSYDNATDSNNTIFTYRKTFYFGAINTNITFPIAHGITGLVQFTQMYGTCVLSGNNYRPIPYTDWLNVQNQITLRADSTNIYVVNGPTATPITSGIVVVEYILG